MRTNLKKTKLIIIINVYFKRSFTSASILLFNISNDVKIYTTSFITLRQ